MRDLYKRLGIDQTASQDDICATIDACQHIALKSEATVVLTVKSRRDEYDRLHGLLSDIGRLRARLGLTHAHYWQGNVANDFSIPPDNQRSRHDELVDKISEAVALHATFLRWRRLWPWYFGGLTSVAALAIVLSVL